MNKGNHGTYTFTITQEDGSYIVRCIHSDGDELESAWTSCPTREEAELNARSRALTLSGQTTARVRCDF